MQDKSSIKGLIGLFVVIRPHYIKFSGVAGLNCPRTDYNAVIMANFVVENSCY